MAKYRKKTFKKRTFKKKRFAKKKFSKGKAREGTLNVKAEARCNMIGSSYTNGSDGVRATVLWGKFGPTNAENWQLDHILSPFETYEWQNWREKFEEYTITGVKI